MQVDMYGRKRFVGWLGSHKLSPGGGLCQQWPTEIDFYITAPMHWVLLYKRGFRDEYGSGQKEKRRSHAQKPGHFGFERCHLVIPPAPKSIS